MRLNQGVRRALMAAVVAAFSVGAVGCGGGGGQRFYYDAWYDVYGNRCYSQAYEPAPGCNFYSDGSKIVDVEDPYFSDPYYGHYLEYNTWDYVDSYGYYQSYTGWGWLSATGILYDDYGYALNEEGQEKGRDMIGDIAEKESAKVAEVGKSFAEKHALSEATGLRIAQTLHDMAVLGKNGGRTQRDYEAFTKKLFGVDAGKAVNALQLAQKGDLAALEGLNTEVATYWGTDPETSKEIAKNWGHHFLKTAKK